MRIAETKNHRQLRSLILEPKRGVPWLEERDTFRNLSEIFLIVKRKCDLFNEVRGELSQAM